MEYHAAVKMNYLDLYVLTFQLWASYIYPRPNPMESSFQGQPSVQGQWQKGPHQTGFVTWLGSQSSLLSPSLTPAQFPSLVLHDQKFCANKSY